MSEAAPAIVWFRNDLRLAGHPALSEAGANGRPILPLYIVEDEGRPLGGAARWWLVGSPARPGDVHEPWKSGTLLARGYPPPLVEHRTRGSALDALVPLRTDRI